MTVNPNEKMSRREKKVQERWTLTTKNNKTSQEQQQQQQTKTFLGVEFPPIAVLRRKFSASPPAKSNTLPIKKKENTSTKPKLFGSKDDKSIPLKDNSNRSNESHLFTPINRSMSLQNQVSLLKSIIN